MKIETLAIGLAVFLAAGNSGAHPPGPPPDAMLFNMDCSKLPRHGPMHALAWVYDTDGNGELDDTERAAMEADFTAGCEARKASFLSRFDADHDGKLSDAEKEM